MPNITVRNIPEAEYSVLRRDAKRHGRSLNAEFLAMLADKKEIARRRAGAVRAMKRIDKIRQEIAAKYPNQPDSVELIREDRDNDEPYR
jgi:plasmid stability protein